VGVDSSFVYFSGCLRIAEAVVAAANIVASICFTGCIRFVDSIVGLLFVSPVVFRLSTPAVGVHVCFSGCLRLSSTLAIVAQCSVCGHRCRSSFVLLFVSPVVFRWCMLPTGSTVLAMHCVVAAYSCLLRLPIGRDTSCVSFRNAALPLAFCWPFVSPVAFRWWQLCAFALSLPLPHAGT
jgi:hypothetical protein